MSRAFSADGVLGLMNPGRCPGLVWMTPLASPTCRISHLSLPLDLGEILLSKNSVLRPRGHSCPLRG